MCRWETGLDDAVTMRSSCFFPDRLAQPLSNVQPSDCCRINAERRPLKLQCHFETFSLQSCFVPPPQAACHPFFLSPSSLLSSLNSFHLFVHFPPRYTDVWSMLLGLIHSSCGSLWIDVYRSYLRLQNTKSYMRSLGKSLVWSHIWRPVGSLENWQLSAVSMRCLGQGNMGYCDLCVCLNAFE